MGSAQRSLRYVVPVVTVIGLAWFLGAAGPGPAASAPAVAAAEVRMYLRIDGIEGECIDDLHKGFMEVLSYSHETNVWGDPHVAEGNTEGELKAFHVTVTRPVGRLSPLLSEYCCRQMPIREITLEVWREGGPVSQKIMAYTGHDCALGIIRNIRSATADELPVEELTFACTGMERTYFEYDASGQVKAEIRAGCDAPVIKGL